MIKKFRLLIFFLLIIFSASACVITMSEDEVNTKIDSKIKEIKNIGNNNEIEENGTYFSKEEVALYLHTFKKLPKNYLTKNEAKNKGWIASKVNLWDVTDKGVIGGDKFGNREGNLPDGNYFEADVNYSGGHRGAERLVYTKEGKVIYYTKDHYKNFEVLYE